MARKIWTAEELEKLTPARQDAIFDESIVTDLDEVPAEFLDRVKARLEEHIVKRDLPKS